MKEECIDSRDRRTQTLVRDFSAHLIQLGFYSQALARDGKRGFPNSSEEGSASGAGPHSDSSQGCSGSGNDLIFEHKFANLIPTSLPESAPPPPPCAQSSSKIHQILLQRLGEGSNRAAIDGQKEGGLEVHAAEKKLAQNLKKVESSRILANKEGLLHFLAIFAATDPSLSKTFYGRLDNEKSDERTDARDQDDLSHPRKLPQPPPTLTQPSQQLPHPNSHPHPQTQPQRGNGTTAHTTPHSPPSPTPQLTNNLALAPRPQQGQFSGQEHSPFPSKLVTSSTAVSEDDDRLHDRLRSTALANDVYEDERRGGDREGRRERKNNGSGLRDDEDEEALGTGRCQSQSRLGEQFLQRHRQPLPQPPAFSASVADRLREEGEAGRFSDRLRPLPIASDFGREDRDKSRWRGGRQEKLGGIGSTGAEVGVEGSDEDPDSEPPPLGPSPPNRRSPSLSLRSPPLSVRSPPSNLRSPLRLASSCQSPARSLAGTTSPAPCVPAVEQYLCVTHSPLEPRPMLIIRDVLYCLQGVNGQHIRFDPSTLRFLVKRDSHASSIVRVLVARALAAGNHFLQLKRLLPELDEGSQPEIDHGLLSDPQAEPSSSQNWVNGWVNGWLNDAGIIDRHCRTYLPFHPPQHTHSHTHSHTYTVAHPHRVVTYFTAQAPLTASLTGRAFAAAVSKQLTHYLAFLAKLEAHMNALQAAGCFDPTGSFLQGLPSSRFRLTSLTLRELVLQLKQPAAFCARLATITAQITALKGNPLLDTLIAQTHTGDADTHALAACLLGAAVEPLFDFLSNLVEKGLLLDPHHEFFIVKRDQTPVGGGAQTSGKSSMVEQNAFDLFYKTLLVDRELLGSLFADSPDTLSRYVTASRLARFLSRYDSTFHRGLTYPSAPRQLHPPPHPPLTKYPSTSAGPFGDRTLLDPALNLVQPSMPGRLNFPALELPWSHPPSTAAATDLSEPLTEAIRGANNRNIDSNIDTNIGSQGLGVLQGLEGSQPSLESMSGSNFGYSGSGARVWDSPITLTSIVRARMDVVVASALRSHSAALATLFRSLLFSAHLAFVHDTLLLMDSAFANRLEDEINRRVLLRGHLDNLTAADRTTCLASALLCLRSLTDSRRTGTAGRMWQRDHRDGCPSAATRQILDFLELKHVSQDVSRNVSHDVAEDVAQDVSSAIPRGGEAGAGEARADITSSWEMLYLSYDRIHAAGALDLLFPKFIICEYERVSRFAYKVRRVRRQQETLWLSAMRNGVVLDFAAETKLVHIFAAAQSLRHGIMQFTQALEHYVFGDVLARVLPPLRLRMDDHLQRGMCGQSYDFVDRMSHDHLEALKVVEHALFLLDWNLVEGAHTHPHTRAPPHTHTHLHMQARDRGTDCDAGSYAFLATSCQLEPSPLPTRNGSRLAATTSGAYSQFKAGLGVEEHECDSEYSGEMGILYNIKGGARRSRTRNIRELIDDSLNLASDLCILFHRLESAIHRQIAELTEVEAAAAGGRQGRRPLARTSEEEKAREYEIYEDTFERFAKRFSRNRAKILRLATELQITYDSEILELFCLRLQTSASM